MPGGPSLDDAWAKLRWGKQNLKTLRTEIETVEQRDTYRVSVELDADVGEYVFRVHDLPTLNPEWGLRIGDCLHAARCALDYTMVNLVALGTNREPEDVEDVQFPIYQELKRFNGAVGELRKEALLSGWLARVDELQPYNAGNPSVWGWRINTSDRLFPRLPYALDRLTYLDNIDKHRCILRPWWGGKLWGGSLKAPAEFRPAGGTRPMDPLVDGAEIGRVQYEAPLPIDWMPDEMDVKRNFPLQIAFNEPSIDKSVVRTLNFCIWGAEMVLTIFQPVFEHHEPPLPVTVSLPRATFLDE